MRPADNNIEKQIKDLRIQASAELDERLHRKFQEAREQKQTDPASHQPIQWSNIIHSRITKFAAVATVLVLAVCWFTVSRTDEPERPGINGPAAAARFDTPAEMVSVISLNMAFRDGGMEAVEEQFDKAEKRVKSGLKENISIDELICELDGC